MLGFTTRRRGTVLGRLFELQVPVSAHPACRADKMDEPSCWIGPAAPSCGPQCQLVPTQRLPRPASPAPATEPSGQRAERFPVISVASRCGHRAGLPGARATSPWMTPRQSVGGHRQHTGPGHPERVQAGGPGHRRAVGARDREDLATSAKWRQPPSVARMSEDSADEMRAKRGRACGTDGGCSPCSRRAVAAPAGRQEC